MATLVQAVRLALHYGEEHLGVTDVFGEDVGPPLGGVFTATQGLRTAWNDGPPGGEYVHPWSSELYPAPGGAPGDQGSIWAAVRVIQEGFDLLTVRTVRLSVSAEEVRKLRGRLVAAPRRLVFGLDGKGREEVRRWSAGIEAAETSPPAVRRRA